MIAVKNTPKIFQYIGDNLKDDYDTFKLAFLQNKRYLNMRVKDYGKQTLNIKFIALTLLTIS